MKELFLFIEYEFSVAAMIKSKFIGKFSLFVVLFLVVNNLVSQIYVHEVLDFTSLNQREQRFDQEKSGVRVLIAGDSHPRYAVKAKYIRNSYLVASSAENVIQTYYRLFDYINIQRLDIQVVVLPIDLHTLSSFRADRFDRPDYWKRFVDFAELGKIKKQPFEYYLLRLDAEFPYIEGITETIEKIKLDSGFTPQDQVFADETQDLKLALRARGRVWMHLKGEDLFEDVSVYYFIRMIKMLQENGIDVVLVKYPVKTIYYIEAEKLIDIDEYYQELHRLLEENHIDCPILDYHDLYWDRPGYFRDADHLTNKASAEFSQVLNDDLVRLGVVP